MFILIPVEDIGRALAESLRNLSFRRLTLLLSDNPICDLQRVNAALVRPYSRLLSAMTNGSLPHTLNTVLTDSTGVSHLYTLSQCHPDLRFISLRDIPHQQLRQITAASEFADLLLRLSLRPIHSVIRNSSNISKSISASERTLNLGNTINSTRLGLWGFGRIGQYIYNNWKHLCSSISYYDPYVQLSSNFTHRALSPFELIHNSDLILLAVTDDLNRNFSLINQSNINLFKDKKLVNISRPYMVDALSVLRSLAANKLISYYSDFPLLFEDTPSSSDLSEIDFLIKDGRLLVLPHVGGATHQSWHTSLKAILSYLDDRDD